MFENNNQYSFAAVKRWGKKVVGGNVFELDKLLIPVNISNRHWCLCVAHVQDKRIEYYDSMGSTGAHYCNGLKRFFADEAKNWVGKVRHSSCKL
jgi:Ulp1 family protease